MQNQTNISLLNFCDQNKSVSWIPSPAGPLVLGVVQVSPPTPAVFFPGFSVTRSTANRRPECEWVGFVAIHVPQREGVTGQKKGAFYLVYILPRLVLYGEFMA